MTSAGYVFPTLCDSPGFGSWRHVRRSCWLWLASPVVIRGDRNRRTSLGHIPVSSTSSGNPWDPTKADSLSYYPVTLKLARQGDELYDFSSTDAARGLVGTVRMTSNGGMDLSGGRLRVYPGPTFCPTHNCHPMCGMMKVSRSALNSPAGANPAIETSQNPAAREPTVRISRRRDNHLRLTWTGTSS